MTSSPHGPYDQGDTHATMAGRMRCFVVTRGESPMPVSVQIGGCNSPP